MKKGTGQRPKTILVTDGNKHIRLLIETELTLEGYGVILAGTGLETLKKVRDQAPDLLILDLRMPDMYDLGILKTIREENHRLPIIASTVYKRAQDQDTIGARGVAGYYVKPFGMSYLKAFVREALEKR